MATTAKFDIRTEAIKPVLASVGATDLAVEKVRDYVAEFQKLVAGVQKTDAKKVRAAVEARVTELQGEAKAYPAKVQSLVDDNVTVAADAYGDLIKRGESLVGRIRRQESTKATTRSAQTTVVKAKTTTTQARKAVDAEVTATKKTATAARNAAKDAVKKAPARKAATKKTNVARSSAKATATAAQSTVVNAAKAVADAAEKIGD